MRKLRRGLIALNLFWDLKELAIRLAIAGLAITIFSIVMKEIYFMLAFLGVLGVVSITLISTWFKQAKPLMNEVEKEIELENRYNWMLKRFENF